MKSRNTSFVRASISFPPDVYRSLGEIAKEKKVSLACPVCGSRVTYAVAQHGDQAVTRDAKLASDSIRIVA